MAERPREVDQRFQVGVNFRLNYRLEGYFSRHSDMAQFTLTHTHHMVKTISSTRPSCWIQISTVDAINVAADHQMFMTLTGELSWQRLRRSAVDFYSKTEKNHTPCQRNRCRYILERQHWSTTESLWWSGMSFAFATIWLRFWNFALCWFSSSINSRLGLY